MKTKKPHLIYGFYPRTKKPAQILYVSPDERQNFSMKFYSGGSLYKVSDADNRIIYSAPVGMHGNASFSLPAGFADTEVYVIVPIDLKTRRRANAPRTQTRLATTEERSQLNLADIVTLVEKATAQRPATSPKNAKKTPEGPIAVA